MLTKLLCLSGLLAQSSALFSKPLSFEGFVAPKMAQRSGTHQLSSKSIGTSLVSFDVKAVPDDNIIDLSTVPGLTSMDCNVQMTSLMMDFESTDELNTFVTSLTLKKEFMFVVGGDKYDGVCAVSHPLMQHLGVRRVVGGRPTSTNTILELITVETRYDEIIEDAQINLNTTSSTFESSARKLGEGDKQVCVGVNTVPGGTCKDTKAPIPLFSNKYLDVECSDCFVGFHADVFLDMSIKGFKLESISGGLRDMYIDASLVVAASGTANWNAGTDKLLELLPDATGIEFKVGLIPFHITFQAPVTVKADVMLQASAKAAAGVTAMLNIGDLYLSWDPSNSWQTHKPVFQPSLTPVVSGSAQFNGQADLSFVPSLIVVFDKVFTYGVTLTPSITATITGSTTTNQICTDVEYQVSLTQYASFDVNVKLLFIHKEFKHTWGPETIFDTGSKTLTKFCKNV